MSCVSRVLEVTQTHIHIHTHTFTPWRVPRGGGLEGRHAHGELEAHGGGGEEYGSCVRENDGCRDSRAMVCNPCVSRLPESFYRYRCLFVPRASPDVRPVNIGNVDRRAILGYLVRGMERAAELHLLACFASF